MFSVSHQYYIQISSDRIIVKYLNTGAVFDEMSTVAMITYKGQRRLLAIGKVAQEAVGEPGVELVKPFEHSRSLISDFDAAVELVKYGFRQVNKGQFYLRRPVVFLQWSPKLDGGFSPIEARVLMEMAQSAISGAKVYLYNDDLPVSDSEVINCLSSIGRRFAIGG